MTSSPAEITTEVFPALPIVSIVVEVTVVADGREPNNIKPLRSPRGCGERSSEVPFQLLVVLARRLPPTAVPVSTLRQ